MTHCERILDYMRTYGGITQAEAYERLGCTRLSGRIYDLKSMGHDIRKSMVHGTNRYGDPVHFAKYTLVEGMT